MPDTTLYLTRKTDGSLVDDANRLVGRVVTDGSGNRLCAGFDSTKRGPRWRHVLTLTAGPPEFVTIRLPDGTSMSRRRLDVACSLSDLLAVGWRAIPGRVVARWRRMKNRIAPVVGVC